MIRCLRPLRKGMRFFFAAQDAQHAEGEGFHLVFAGQHMYRSEEGHTLRHPVREHPGAGDAARKQNGVEAAPCHHGELADIFRQIVGHGLVNQRGLPVTLVDAALDFPRVGRPEPVHQPPLPLHPAHHLGEGDAILRRHFRKLEARQATGTLGRERPFIVGNHIHDTPAHMQGKGDPPAHVRDNQG